LALLASFLLAVVVDLCCNSFGLGTSSVVCCFRCCCCCWCFFSRIKCDRNQQKIIWKLDAASDLIE
jgi:hypothetical protein